MKNFKKYLLEKITFLKSLFTIRILHGESGKGQSYNSKDKNIFKGGVLGTGKEKKAPNTPDFKDWKDV